MYEPAYKCVGLKCENRVRSEGCHCPVCYGAFGWMNDFVCEGTRFVDGNWLYITLPQPTSEAEAVALMKEYAA